MAQVVGMKQRRPKNQLLALRNVLGLRQKDVADLLEVAPDTLGRYEVGTRRITLELKRKLARTFGIDPKTLGTRLRDQWGQLYSRSSWEKWKLLTESEREQVMDFEALLTAEIVRLFGAARKKGRVCPWGGKLLRLLGKMAEDLDEVPPMRIMALDVPLQFELGNKREAGEEFQLGNVVFETLKDGAPEQRAPADVAAS